MQAIQMIELNQQNLEEEGGYCLRSKPLSTGYQNKNNWLKDELAAGLKYIKLMENGKQAGFIEYTAAEYSSRVVHANDYMIIHCLWVNISGKGHGTRLIHKCIEDARQQNKCGVAVITNSDTSWTPSKDIFLKNGFTLIQEAPYGFELLVHPLKDGPLPFFPNNWEERLKTSDELTIFRTNQCPFVDVATENMLEGARKLGLEAKVIDIKNREELMALSPTPYGIFGVTYHGQLVTFHRLTVHSAIKKLKSLCN
ncbi:GNAT family N-acetyltransferase [Paenibacillus oralis]|uniref:GNAT family N-acetyltransferase n=3 Tax=Paenibacillus TaxID=44249 RepID=A0A3P3U7L2_9BACL|nr:GNAT family N-acetyltransferase [Paenibacillus oralis]RRJ65696.1 GNAT family N-acetyltransferase [Paenibacillus oralis]